MGKKSLDKLNVTSKVETSRRNLLKASMVAAATGVVALSPMQSLMAANEGKAADGEPIPLGSAVPLTGWAAADGIEYKRGVELACEQINAVGGVLGRPLHPHFEDTKNMGAENVIPALQRLIDRHDVHGIVCGYNGGTGTAEYDVVAESGLVYIHHNTDIQHHHTMEGNLDKYPTIFMGDPAEYWYGEGLLTFLKNLEGSGQFDAGERKMALIQGADNYGIVIGSAIKDKAKSYGWTITMTESVSAPMSEWGSIISKLRQSPPDVIAFTHWVPQDLAMFMNQFANNPTKSLIYMQYGPSIAAFREIAGVNSEGVIYSSVAQSLQDEIGTNYMKDYRSMHGKSASPLNGALPYDSTYMFAIAAALAGGTANQDDAEQNLKIARRLRGMIHRGVMGVTRFFPDVQAAIPYPDATQDPSLGMPHQYAQIHNHKEDAKLISPSPYETAKFIVPSWIS